jgi:hypothetical protein
MPSELTRCANCGAPLQVGSPRCRYCGAPGPAAEQAPPAPPEITQAVSAIRARMEDPQRLLDYLASALSRLDASWVRVQRAMFRSKISRLQLVLGTIHYEMRQDGPGCVVERQTVAAGMPVGMKDLVPASRWPELLVLDVARAADERGLGWQAVGRVLS